MEQEGEVTIEQILEILENYKLRIPPTVFYDLKADIVNFEEPTTKNDLGVDCISRAEAIKCLECDFDITGKENMKTVVNYINSAHDKIVNLPRVKQEPKPMVEIDLYSVIKQKYIEREVLDKIRVEIEGMTPTYHNPDWSITDLVPISEVLKLVDKYKADRSEE